jgi:hypothetical protein
MSEDRTDAAASMRREVDELAALMSPALIDALAAAAADDDLWLEAARDTRGFLLEKGVELPEWAVIRLEALTPTSRVMTTKDLPKCKDGEVLVTAPGGAYCSRRVLVCRRYPHIGQVCIFRYCLKWETEWLEGRCLPVRDLFYPAMGSHTLPAEYHDPEG